MDISSSKSVISSKGMKRKKRKKLTKETTNEREKKVQTEIRRHMDGLMGRNHISGSKSVIKAKKRNEGPKNEERTNRSSFFKKTKFPWFEKIPFFLYLFISVFSLLLTFLFLAAPVKGSYRKQQINKSPKHLIQSEFAPSPNFSPKTSPTFRRSTGSDSKKKEPASPYGIAFFPSFSLFSFSFYLLLVLFFPLFFSFSVFLFSFFLGSFSLFLSGFSFFLFSYLVYFLFFILKN